jgi:hypothetical protein
MREVALFRGAPGSCRRGLHSSYDPMGNLFLSFSIAIGSAICLVTLSRSFDLEFFTTKVLPLIPIFYALVYEVLEHRKKDRPGKGTAALPRDEARKSLASEEAGITPGKVIVDVAVSFCTKFSIEIFLVALFLRFSGQSFDSVYGTFNIETVGSFLRGDHPWLISKEGIYLLALVAIITSLVTGSWIGHTSKGNAILEGVFTGAAVTIITSMTNMVVLYRSIEDMTARLADSMGYVLRAGFLVVIGLQVLLYGLWSGLVQRKVKKREGVKKAGRKPKK